MNVCFEVGQIKNDDRYWIKGWSDRKNYSTQPSDLGPLGPFRTFEDAEKYLMRMIEKVEEQTGSKATLTDYRDISNKGLH